VYKKWMLDLVVAGDVGVALNDQLGPLVEETAEARK